MVLFRAYTQTVALSRPKNGRSFVTILRNHFLQYITDFFPHLRAHAHGIVPSPPHRAFVRDWRRCRCRKLLRRRITRWPIIWSSRRRPSRALHALRFSTQSRHGSSSNDTRWETSMRLTAESSIPDVHAECEPPVTLPVCAKLIPSRGSSFEFVGAVV